MLKGVRAEVINCPDFVMSEEGSTSKFTKRKF
jgi:hypothetical protein